MDVSSHANTIENVRSSDKNLYEMINSSYAQFSYKEIF